MFLAYPSRRAILRKKETDMRICSVQDCDNEVEARGMCSKHYTRVKRYGNIHEVRKPRGEARKYFFELVKLDEENCVSWPFTVSGLAKRPWMQMPDGRRGNVAIFLCEALNGPAPTKKHQAAHNCGNPSCVNAKHLRWATAKENSEDQVKHGTRVKGDALWCSKLTASDVIDIRMSTERHVDLAKRYGVLPQQIYRIRKKLRWAHVV
jgi:hypothetical protein